MNHWLDKVVALLQADTTDLRELARMAGADPSIFYRGIDPGDLDLDGQNLAGMEFSSPPPKKTEFGDQYALELASPSSETPEQLAFKIKGTRRQEERAALLLAEFLRDRTQGMKVIDRYSHDRATLAHNVLHVLKEVHRKESTGTKFDNVQIARRVSGCFAKAEDKRSFVAYYFAKHLHQYPEIRTWLRTKSTGRLSREQQAEFDHYLSAT